jgi:hypothetical protein
MISVMVMGLSAAAVAITQASHCHMPLVKTLSKPSQPIGDLISWVLRQGARAFHATDLWNAAASCLARTPACRRSLQL